MILVGDTLSNSARLSQRGDVRTVCSASVYEQLNVQVSGRACFLVFKGTTRANADTDSQGREHGARSSCPAWRQWFSYTSSRQCPRRVVVGGCHLIQVAIFCIDAMSIENRGGDHTPPAASVHAGPRRKLPLMTGVSILHCCLAQ